MLQKRLIALVILLVGAGIGWWVYSAEVSGSHPFKLGLDLSGGTQLVYRAELSGIPGEDVRDSMDALRDTIERRGKLFCVLETKMEKKPGGQFAGGDEET